MQSTSTHNGDYRKYIKLETTSSTDLEKTTLTEERVSSNMNENGVKIFITIAVCATIIVTTAIIGGYYYNMNDRNRMSQNIENAINKGVDPISVKCAYETTVNSTCIAYAATAAAKAK